MEVKIKNKAAAVRGAVHTDEGPIGKTLFSFAVPIIVMQLLQEFYNAADCFVVGNFAGKGALPAVGLSGLVLSVIVNFFVGFSSGISVLTSQLFGRRETNRLGQLIVSAVGLAIIAGAVFTAVAETLAGQILFILHCPDAVVPEARIYLGICLLGLAAQLLTGICQAILRSLGDTRTPLILFACSALMNLVLDLVLVIGLSSGIKGAAITTVASEWLLAITMLHSLMARSKGLYSFSNKNISTSHVRNLRDMLFLGFPAGMQALFMSISSLLIQTSINSFGPEAMGGMTVYAKLEGLLYYPAFSYGIALTAFVGQNYGAGRLDRIRQATRTSIISMMAAVIPLSLLLMYFSYPLLRLFTPDEGIVFNAHEAVMYTFPVYALYAVNQIFLGAIKGMGNTIYPMACTLVCYALFRCRLMLPFFPSMHIVYLSYDISFALMLAMLLPVYLMKLARLSRLRNSQKL